MSEGKRGPGRPKKQGQQVTGEVAQRPDDAAPGEQIEGKGLPPAADEQLGEVAQAADEIKVRVVKHFERNGVKVPVGTVFATRDTREIRRHLKHRCLEQVG